MIVKTVMPQSSILKKNSYSYDYSDSFCGSFSDKKNIAVITSVGKFFFLAKSKWISRLFSARNNIVKLFGLKIANNEADRQKQLDSFECEIGQKVGLFSVFARNENEVIIGEDDKHLDFRVSLFLKKSFFTEESEQKQLIITTVVKFHNIYGRIYFLVVRPFHKLVVVSILKKIIQQIDRA